MQYKAMKLHTAWLYQGCTRSMPRMFQSGLAWIILTVCSRRRRLEPVVHEAP